MFLYLVRIADIALFVHMQRLRQVFQQRCMLPEIFFLPVCKIWNLPIECFCAFIRG